jgi:Type ISP C-terminal specificity domain
LIPQNVEVRVEYERAWKLPEIMSRKNVGFVTARDSFVVSQSKSDLLNRLEQFRASERNISTAYLKQTFGLKDTSSWNLQKARAGLRANANWNDDLINCAYRPFDTRFIYYSASMLERPVYQIQRHLIGGRNRAFACSRQQSLPGHGP